MLKDVHSKCVDDTTKEIMQLRMHWLELGRVYIIQRLFVSNKE